MRKTFRRVSALLTAIIFCFSEGALYAQMRFSAYSPETPAASLAGLSLPRETGVLERKASGKGPVIFHIQEAHGDAASQKKIEKILRYLHQEHGVRDIFLEGNAAPLHPEFLRFFPEKPEWTREAVRSLVKTGAASGPALFLALHPQTHAHPLEEPGLYEAHMRAFRDVLSQREKTARFIEDLDMQIKRVSSPYLSAGLRQWLGRAEDYQDGKISLQAWLGELREKSQEYLQKDPASPEWQAEFPMTARIFALQRLEKDNDEKAYAGERKVFLSDAARFLTPPERLSLEAFLEGIENTEMDLILEGVFEKLAVELDYAQYPCVMRAAGKAFLQKEVSSRELSAEMSSLQRQIETRMAKTALEKEMVLLFQDYGLLRKLWRLELTPEDWDAVTAAPETRFSPSGLARRFLEINKPGRVKDFYFEHLEEMDSLFQKALEFYRLARRRDAAMLERMESSIAEHSMKSAVVITGGFHAGPFYEHFRSKRQSYVLISPVMPQAAGRDPYIEKVLTQYRPEGSALRLFDAPLTALADFPQGWDWRPSRREMQQAVETVLKKAGQNYVQWRGRLAFEQDKQKARSETRGFMDVALKDSQRLEEMEKRIWQAGEEHYLNDVFILDEPERRRVTLYNPAGFQIASRTVESSRPHRGKPPLITLADFLRQEAEAYLKDLIHPDMDVLEARVTLEESLDDQGTPWFDIYLEFPETPPPLDLTSISKLPEVRSPESFSRIFEQWYPLLFVQRPADIALMDRQAEARERAGVHNDPALYREAGLERMGEAAYLIRSLLSEGVSHDEIARRIRQLFRKAADDFVQAGDHPIREPRWQRVGDFDYGLSDLTENTLAVVEIMARQYNLARRTQKSEVRAHSGVQQILESPKFDARMDMAASIRAYLERHVYTGAPYLKEMMEKITASESYIRWLLYGYQPDADDQPAIYVTHMGMPFETRNPVFTIPVEIQNEIDAKNVSRGSIHRLLNDLSLYLTLTHGFAFDWEPSWDKDESFEKQMISRKGFDESVAEFRLRLADGTRRESRFEGTVTQLALLTHERSRIQETVDAYVQNLESFGHQGVTLFIFDDSQDEERLKRRQAVMAREESYAKRGVRLIYFGLEERLERMKALARKILETPAGEALGEEKIIKFVHAALDPSGGVGANRNWVNLMLGDEPFAMVDDDVLPEATVEAGGSLMDARVPVDFLSILNRALQDSAHHTVSFRYSGYRDDSILQNLQAYDRDPEYRSPFLGEFKGVEKIPQEKTHAYRTQGGIWALRGRFENGLLAAPPSNPQRLNYLRMEDMSPGLVSRYFLGALTPDHVSPVYYPAAYVDHRRESKGRPQMSGIIKPLFLEMLAQKMYGRYLHDVFDQAVLKKLKNDKNQLFIDAAFTDYGRALEASLDTHLQKFLENPNVKNGLGEGLEELLELYDMPGKGLSGDYEFKSGVRELFKELGLINSSGQPELEVVKIRAETLERYLRPELEIYAETLQIWPLLVRAAGDNPLLSWNAASRRLAGLAEAETNKAAAEPSAKSELRSGRFLAAESSRQWFFKWKAARILTAGRDETPRGRSEVRASRFETETLPGLLQTIAAMVPAARRLSTDPDFAVSASFWRRLNRMARESEAWIELEILSTQEYTTDWNKGLPQLLPVRSKTVRDIVQDPDARNFIGYLLAMQYAALDEKVVMEVGPKGIHAVQMTIARPPTDVEIEQFVRLVSEARLVLYKQGRLEESAGYPADALLPIRNYRLLEAAAEAGSRFLEVGTQDNIPAVMEQTLNFLSERLKTESSVRADEFFAVLTAAEPLLSMRLFKRIVDIMTSDLPETTAGPDKQAAAPDAALQPPVIRQGTSTHAPAVSAEQIIYEALIKFYDQHSEPERQNLDGTLFVPSPLRLLPVIFNEIERALGRPLAGANYLSFGAGLLHDSLYAAVLRQMNVQAVEKDPILSLTAGQLFADARSRFPFPENFELNAHTDALDLSWAQQDVIYFFFTQPTEPRAEAARALFERKLTARMAEMKPGAVLAVLMTGAQLLGREDPVFLRELAYDQVHLSDERSGLYLMLYKIPEQAGNAKSEVRSTPDPEQAVPSGLRPDQVLFQAQNPAGITLAIRFIDFFFKMAEENVAVDFKTGSREFHFHVPPEGTDVFYTPPGGVEQLILSSAYRLAGVADGEFVYEQDYPVYLVWSEQTKWLEGVYVSVDAAGTEFIKFEILRKASGRSKYEPYNVLPVITDMQMKGPLIVGEQSAFLSKAEKNKMVLSATLVPAESKRSEVRNAPPPELAAESDKFFVSYDQIEQADRFSITVAGEDGRLYSFMFSYADGRLSIRLEGLELAEELPGFMVGEDAEKLELNAGEIQKQEGLLKAFQEGKLKITEGIPPGVDPQNLVKQLILEIQKKISLLKGGYFSVSHGEFENENGIWIQRGIHEDRLLPYEIRYEARSEVRRRIIEEIFTPSFVLLTQYGRGGLLPLSMRQKFGEDLYVEAVRELNRRLREQNAPPQLDADLLEHMRTHMPELSGFFQAVSKGEIQRLLDDQAAKTYSPENFLPIIAMLAARPDVRYTAFIEKDAEGLKQFKKQIREAALNSRLAFDPFQLPNFDIRSASGGGQTQRMIRREMSRNQRPAAILSKNAGLFETLYAVPGLVRIHVKNPLRQRDAVLLAASTLDELLQRKLRIYDEDQLASENIGAQLLQQIAALQAYLASA